MSAEKKVDAAATTPEAPAHPSGGLGIVGTSTNAMGWIGAMAEATANAVKKIVPKPVRVPPHVPLPPSLAAGDISGETSYGGIVDLRGVVVPNAAAKSFSFKPREYKPDFDCLARTRRDVWRELLGAGTYEPLTHVEGELLEASATRMHTELVGLRNYYMEHCDSSRETLSAFVDWMLVVAIQKWRRNVSAALEALAAAWVAPWQHSSHRDKLHTSEGDGTAPEPQRPLRSPSGLGRTAMEIAAGPWIFQGEGIAEVEETLAIRKAKVQAEQHAAAVDAGTARVRIVPAEKGIIVLRTLNPNAVEPGTNAGTSRIDGRELLACTFAWPFPVPAEIVATGGTRPWTYVHTEEIEVTERDLVMAANRALPIWAIKPLLSHMGSLTGAPDPIPESDFITNKNGLFIMRSRVSAFKKILDHMMPVLKIHAAESVAWHHGAILQAGVRGLLLHPLAVASHIERAAKGMGEFSRAWATDIMGVAEAAWGVARGGPGSWCPAGYLVDEKKKGSDK